MPNQQEVQDKIVELVCKRLGVQKERVKMETTFINDLGADSLDTVELVMEIEEAFERSIPEEEQEKIQSVGDAVRYICSTNP